MAFGLLITLSSLCNIEIRMTKPPKIQFFFGIPQYQFIHGTNRRSYRLHVTKKFNYQKNKAKRNKTPFYVPLYYCLLLENESYKTFIKAKIINRR